MSKEEKENKFNMFTTNILSIWIRILFSTGDGCEKMYVNTSGKFSTSSTNWCLYVHGNYSTSNNETASGRIIDVYIYIHTGGGIGSFLVFDAE